MPLQIGDKLPVLDYTLVELINQGGHALVYKATHPTFLPKAVKILKPGMLPDIIDGFIREGLLLDGFDHPYIIRGCHSFKLGDQLIIVMQYADGGSLRDLLDKQRMPIIDALKLARAVGSAIDYAHKQNVLLLDINPANILRVGGKWVLSDFGIAVYDSPNLLLPSAHGTPGYVAPEMWAHKPVQSSDLFALGCVLYEVLCGHPIDFGSMKDLLGPDPLPLLPPDPAIPDEARYVLAQVLHKDSTKRFDSAAEFVEELRASFAGRRKVAKTAVARPSTIQVALVAHIGAMGRPRCITFNQNGRLLLWTVGKSLGGYNTLTGLYLQGQASRGLYFNDAITQIDFIDQTQAWILCGGALQLVKFDKLATGTGDDGVVLSNAAITGEAIGCFARSPHDVVFASSTSPTLRLYSLQGDKVGRLRVIYRMPDEQAKITSVAWQGTDVVFSTSSIYQGSAVYRWVDAHLADPKPTIQPLLDYISTEPFKSVPVFERLIVKDNYVAILTKEEIRLVGGRSVTIRPGGTVTDACWFREFLVIGVRDPESRDSYHRVELYDTGGDLRFEFPPQTYKLGRPESIWVGTWNDIIVFNAIAGLDFYRVL